MRNSQKQPEKVICHVHKLAIILNQNKANIVMLPQKYHSLVIKHCNNLSLVIKMLAKIIIFTRGSRTLKILRAHLSHLAVFNFMHYRRSS